MYIHSQVLGVTLNTNKNIRTLYSLFTSKEQ